MTKQAPKSYYTLSTERLSFRKLTMEDISSWEAFFSNNPFVHFVGVDVSKNETPKQISTDWINRQLGRYTEDGFGMLAVIEKSSNQLIGMSGIMSRIVDNKKEKEIGYSFLPATWGKGYASEAAICLHKFGIKNQLADRFISIIHLDNKASMRVAKKNGMIPLFETNYMNMKVIVYGA